MNNADLFRAVGEAGDELIEIKERRIGLWAYIGIAAAALLTAGAAALVILKPWKSDPRRTASLDPTDRPAITDKANITIAPAELPTPEPTPLLDLTGWKVVTGEGGSGRHYEEAAVELAPLEIQDKLKAELDKPENEGSLFKVEIMVLDPYAKLSEEEHEKAVNESKRWEEEFNRFREEEPLFREFHDAFIDWFDNVYFPDCPFRMEAHTYYDSLPQDHWNYPADLFWWTFLDKRFPNYFELFLSYLDENGESDKAESFGPVAERSYTLLYNDCYLRPQEYKRAIHEEAERLISLGYRIDIDLFDETYGTDDNLCGVLTAFLTKEQILDFAGDPAYSYYISFSFEAVGYGGSFYYN